MMDSLKNTRLSGLICVFLYVIWKCHGGAKMHRIMSIPKKTPWIISIKIRNNMHKTFKPFVNDVYFLRPNSAVNNNGFMNEIC